MALLFSTAYPGRLLCHMPGKTPQPKGQASLVAGDKSSVSGAWFSRISGAHVELRVGPGDDATLYSDCVSEDKFNIVWFRNCSHQHQPLLMLSTRDLMRDIHPRYSAVWNPSNHTYDLLVKNVSESDLGLYYCAVHERKITKDSSGVIVSEDVYHYGNRTTRLSLPASCADPVQTPSVCWKLLRLVENEGGQHRAGEGEKLKRASILVLTTVPPHTDSLGVSTKTKAGLVTEDDPPPCHSMTVWYDTTAVFGDGDVVLRTVVVTVCVHVVLRGAAVCRWCCTNRMTPLLAVMVDVGSVRRTDPEHLVFSFVLLEDVDSPVYRELMEEVQEIWMVGNFTRSFITDGHCMEQPCFPLGTEAEGVGSAW
ncbi:hypothetical protein NFI96_006024 [Prochilodus magdalenae]|nr:hypothetical protein NFI96_006024 [Prochilodus magdalenae]